MFFLFLLTYHKALNKEGLMEHSLEVEVKKSIVDLESVSVAPSDLIFMEFYYSS
jgi:hypothetical protein